MPFRSSLDETTLRAGVRKSLSETVNGSLTYVHANRDGGHYKNPDSVGEPNENTINPLNIADRKRNKLRGVADWAPMENLSLQFIAEVSKDNYSGQPYGLDRRALPRPITLDGSYQLGQNWSVNAWFTLDQTKADENTQNGTVVLKDNMLKENGTSYGVGLRGTVMDKLKLGADVERFRSDNKYQPGPDRRRARLQHGADARHHQQDAPAEGIRPVPDAKNADLRVQHDPGEILHQRLVVVTDVPAHRRNGLRSTARRRTEPR